MSYRYTIKVSKTIEEKDIDDIVKELPERYRDSLGVVGRQDWGWHCCCDVYNPIDDTIDIGGSYSTSGWISEEFTKYIGERLEEKGYNVIKIIFDW